MIAKLRGKSEEERKAALVPKVYSSDEAKANFNIDLPNPDYMLRITPDSTREPGYKLSYITPLNYEIHDDQTITTPEGKTFTVDEFQKKIEQEQQLPESGVPAKQLSIQTGLKAPTWEDFGDIYTVNPLGFVANTQIEAQKREYQNIKDIFGDVFPQQDIDNILNFADTDPQGFLEAIQQAGRTKDTEFLTQKMFPDITPVEMKEIFGEPITEWEYFTLPIASEADLRYRIASGMISQISQSRKTATESYGELVPTEGRFIKDWMAEQGFGTKPILDTSAFQMLESTPGALSRLPKKDKVDYEYARKYYDKLDEASKEYVKRFGEGAQMRSAIGKVLPYVLPGVGKAVSPESYLDFQSQYIKEHKLDMTMPPIATDPDFSEEQVVNDTTRLIQNLTEVQQAYNQVGGTARIEPSDVAWDVAVLIPGLGWITKAGKIVRDAAEAARIAKALNLTSMAIATGASATLTAQYWDEMSPKMKAFQVGMTTLLGVGTAWGSLSRAQQKAVIAELKNITGKVKTKAGEVITSETGAVKIPGGGEETPKVPETPKEPWQMTREEEIANKLEINGFHQKGNKWYRIDANGKEVEASSYAERVKEEFAGGHRYSIEKALSEGKPVPADVLKDYPDLAKAQPVVSAEAKATTGGIEAIKPTTEMAKGTSVQTGLAGMGKEAGQVKMFEEGAGGGVKQPLVDVEAIKKAEVAKPLPGQVDMFPEAGRTYQEIGEDLYKAEMELSGLKETLEQHPANDITGIITQKLGKKEGAFSYITPNEYRQLTGAKWKVQTGTVNGKTVKTKVLIGGREPTSGMMTPDGKNVKWEYALDTMAEDRGYAGANELKAGIEEAKSLREQITKRTNEVNTLRSEFATTPKTQPLVSETTKTTTGGISETVQPQTVEELEAQVVKGVEIPPTEVIEYHPEPIKDVTTGIETKMTTAETETMLKKFGDVLDSPETIELWETTQELRKLERAKRAESFKSRWDEIYLNTGDETKAFETAIKETMSGKLPSVTKDVFEKFWTNEIIDALYAKVAFVLKDNPYEYMSTREALTNALAGQPIPQIPGIKGGSALTRLQKVFSDNPPILKAIEKAAEEKKPLKDVVEGIFHETGREPIPPDAETMEYLRSLRNVPREQVKLGGKPDELILELKENLMEKPPEKIGLSFKETRTKAQIETDLQKFGTEITPEPVQITMFEAPIDDAFKALPMIPATQRNIIWRGLKEIGTTAVDIGNFLRAMRASADMSWWRQQSPLIMNNKKGFAAANLESWKAMWSEKSAEASWSRIINDPIYHIYDKTDLDFLRPRTLPKGTAQWKGVEEYGFTTGQNRPIPKLTAKLPWVKVSERSFVTGTNEHNWRIFKQYYENINKISEKIGKGEIKLKVGEVFSIEKEMKDFGKMLESMTGRAQLGNVGKLAPAINAGFFSMRLNLGRILTPTFLWSSNPRVRMEAWKNLISFVGTVSGVLLLGKQLGIWDVETDNRSADFMKVRIGNTRIDPWGGFQQYVVMLSRINPFGSDKGVSSITGAEYPADTYDTLTKFVRSKLSPFASAISEIWTGETYLGEKVTLTDKKQWIDRFAPLALADIYEAFKDDIATGALVTIPSLVGAGTQTYTGDWVDDFSSLGLPKYSDNLDYGVTEPIYDVKDLWANNVIKIKGVDPKEYSIEKGFPKYMTVMAEALKTKNTLSDIPNVKLSEIKKDTETGATIVEYRKMWLDRQKLLNDPDALAKFDTDKRTSKAYFGNMSQRDYANLVEYNNIQDNTQKAKFLESHPELEVNPREQYLIDNPEENAKLAIFGQEKILTQKAYDKAVTLLDEMDFPLQSYSEYIPPKELAIDYIKVQEETAKHGSSSWEVSLILKKNSKLIEWLGRKEPTSKLEVLELKVKNADLLRLYESYGDEDSPNYLPSYPKKSDYSYRKGREYAREQMLNKYPAFAKDKKQIDALEHGSITTVTSKSAQDLINQALR
jgi:hypothetical protein